MENQDSDSRCGQVPCPQDNLPKSLINKVEHSSPQYTNEDALLADALTPKPNRVRNRRPVDPHGIWQQLLSEFAMEMPANHLDAWIQASQVLHYEDGQFIVGLPNAYYLDWAQDRLRPQIKRKLASIMQRQSIDVVFRVMPASMNSQLQPQKPAPLYETAGESVAFEPVAIQTQMHAVEPVPPAPTTMKPSHKVVPSSGAGAIGPINSKYTFDSFVVGKHNRMAFAAAEEIARTPGQRFNPLYIYGGVGLGKTHLLNAIANRLVEHGHSVLYCSTEQFTNDLVHAIRDRSTDLFRTKYRAIDVLLLDDIQFIVGKESTQEELFHTFNYLHAAGKQVVFTSDCPPRDLPRLEERLRSRFEGGLTTDIVAPDFETRVAILQTKIARQSIQVSYDVLMLIADRVKSNVRELEGALNNVWLHAQTHGQPIDINLTETVLGSVAPRRSVCTPTCTVGRVASYFGMTVNDLTGRRRTADVARARQIAMFLLREENGLSLPAIGEHLGGRDHSTVSHGVEKIGKEIQGDETLRHMVVKLREQLYQP